MRACLALQFHNGTIRRLPYVSHMLKIDVNHINIHTHPTLNFQDYWDIRLPSNFIHIPSPHQLLTSLTLCNDLTST